MIGKRIPRTNPGLGELATPLEFLRLALRWPTLPGDHTGGRSTVVLVPGFGATEGSLFALHRYLERRDFEAVPWGLGRNHGDVPQLMPLLAERVRELTRERGEPVALVGWSLGGYLAREAARDEPASVRHVVTICSPITGAPKYTAVAPYYRRKGFDVDEIEREVAERYRIPLRVPVTAIHSRRDGVVAWRACIDEWSPNVERMRAGSTHVGLGFSPEVPEIVADRLKPAARARGTELGSPESALGAGICSAWRRPLLADTAPAPTSAAPVSSHPPREPTVNGRERPKADLNLGSALTKAFEPQSFDEQRERRG